MEILFLIILSYISVLFINTEKATIWIRKDLKIVQKMFLSCIKHFSMVLKLNHLADFIHFFTFLNIWLIPYSKHANLIECTVLNLSCSLTYTYNNFKNYESDISGPENESHIIHTYTTIKYIYVRKYISFAKMDHILETT